MGPTCKLFRYFKALKVKRTLLTKAYMANAGGSQQAKGTLPSISACQALPPPFFTDWTSCRNRFEAIVPRFGDVETAANSQDDEKDSEEEPNVGV